jgi:ATP-binding cassette, subfamily B, multidrug efflux pump
VDTRNLRNDMFIHMEGLPIRYFDTHPHGDIMSTYTNDIDTLRQMISQSIPQVLNSAVTIVSVLGAMIVLNIPLTIITLFMVGVMLYATKVVGGASAKYFIAQQRDIATVNGYIEEMMNGQKVVKVFTHEEESIADFNKLNDQLFESADNANKFGNILMPINAQLGNVSYVLVALVGGILALEGIGGFTLGKLASFLTFNKSFSQPINQLSMQINNIVMALAGSERIFNLLDEKPETDDGYVTLVRAKKENGQITECSERTGMWAWKHVHQADGSVDYIELKGDVVFDDVSGGQKQRLCIARALLKNPKILILDDSTSAVDTATDAKIRKAFAEEIPNTTKLIIAQRISSVMNADRIIVLNNGVVDGFGSHEELMETNAIYREVYESQTQGSGDFDEGGAK